GTVSGTQNLAISSNLGRATLSPIVDAANHQIDVQVTTNGAANLYWNSTSSGVWDSFVSNASPGTANWYNSGILASDTFHSGDNVNFADSGSAVGSNHLQNGLQTNITLASTVTPGSLTDTASSATNYTFSGAGGIGGSSASVTMSGTGTLTLETANT